MLLHRLMSNSNTTGPKAYNAEKVSIPLHHGSKSNLNGSYLSRIQCFSTPKIGSIGSMESHLLLIFDSRSLEGFTQLPIPELMIIDLM